MALVGLKDFYSAKFNEDGTYETPRKLSPAMTANITPNMNSVTLYGDDHAVEVAEGLADINVEIGVTDLKDEDYAFLLGKTINADGVIEDSTDDVAPYVAIGFRAQKANGKYRYVWLYKGKFTIPTDSHQTKGENIQFQTPTLSGKFVARDDGKWRARADEDNGTINQAVIANWFNEVYKPTVTP